MVRLKNPMTKGRYSTLLYQWQCVLPLCECASVYPAVPTVTYFGHLLPGRAGDVPLKQHLGNR